MVNYHMCCTAQLWLMAPFGFFVTPITRASSSHGFDIVLRLLYLLCSQLARLCTCLNEATKKTIQNNMNSTVAGSKETPVLPTYDTLLVWGFVLECFAYLPLIRNQEMKGLPLKTSRIISVMVSPATRTWFFTIMPLPLQIIICVFRRPSCADRVMEIRPLLVGNNCSSENNCLLRRNGKCTAGCI